MAFDAGAVESSLTIDTSQFDRSLDAAEARVKRFEDAKHEIKVSAVFDTSSLSRARQQFAQLDQQISKDAMSRLRSNPQGSVLGALNALFSPHPVTGAPSPTQAAQQGLLGKIIQSPGGGGTTGPQSGQNTVSQVLGSSSGSGQSNANNITTTDRVNTVGLPSDNSITTTDRVNVTGLPSSGGTITTTDRIEPDVDTASLKAKAAAAAKDAADAADDALTKESRAKGSGWFSGFLSGIGSMVTKALGDAGSAGGGGGSNGKDKSSGGDSGGILDSGLIGGIGPGILGTSFKGASIAGLLGAGIGAIPALAAATAPLGIAGAGAGIVSLGASQLIGSKDTKSNPNAQGPLYQQAQQAGQALQTMVQSAASGLVGPLKSLFAQIPALAKQITPALTQVFSGAVALIQPAVNGLVSVIKQVGPLLGQAFKATGPLLEPLIKGIGSLVSGLMPGLIAMLKAAGPAVAVVSGFFGTLGANLGQMFKDFSTVIGPSSTILKALLDVVSGLLPVIGSLAQILASALGPAFTAFAGAIKALEPFLVTVGKIFAQFAGAVLTDLAGGLQLVASVLKAVSPALNQLATVLGQVFNTLESKGAFAQLGNILESLATPLGNLISKLVSGLAPAIPPLLNLFGQFVNVISSVGVQVLSALIPPLTQLAETALGALVKVLPLVIPVVTQLLSAFTADAGNLISEIGGSLLNLANVVLTALLKAAAPLIPVVLGLVQAFIPLLNLFTTAVAASVAAVANALAAVVNAIPSGALTAVIAGVGGVVAAMKLWGGVTSVLSSGIETTMASAVGGMIGTLKEFALATEGVTLAQKAQLAGMLALDAVSPLAWAAAGAAALGALTYALVAVNAQSQTVVGGFAQQESQLDYNISGYQKLASTVETASQGYAKFAKSSTDAVRGGAAGAQSLSNQLSAQAQQISQTGVTMLQRVGDLSKGLGVSTTVIEQWAHAAGISAQQFGGTGENVGSLTQKVVDFVNKNAAAITATSSLSTNIAIFGSDVLSANTQLDAFNSIWNTLVGNLLTKQQAVTQSKTAFDSLKQSIQDNGKASDATQQSFQAYMSQIGSSVAGLEKSGASVHDVNSYLQDQIDNLTSLGPLNKSQQADVDALKAAQDAYANSTHGLNAEQQSLISQFQQGLIPSLQQIHGVSPAVNTDIKNIADSIIQTGNNSASTASDRAKLIADLKQAGATSQQATQFVNSLQGSIDKLKGKVVSVGVNVSAAGKAAATALVQGEATLHDSITFQTQGAAMGGLISGGTPGKDSVLGLLMPGEVVVPTKMVQAGAVDHLRGKLPGFAGGGMIDLAAPVNQAAAADQNWSQASALQWATASVKAFQTAAAAAATAAANAFVATQGASGGIIQSLMKNMAAAKGWTGAELNALFDVEQREAGFNMTATNPTSGAYGLAQFINGPSEYAQYGGDSTTAQGQITAMLNYVQQRYGDPINAWNHELQYGWYDRGGWLKPGYTLAYNGTGRPEQVVPPGADSTEILARIEAHMKRLIQVTGQVPAGVGAHVGNAINGASHDASFRSRYPRSN